MSDVELFLESRPASGPGAALQKLLIERIAVDENVPSGILHRCSVSSGRIRQYGGGSDSPTCSHVEFEELYGEIAFSYHHGAELLPVSAVADRAKSYTDRGLTPVFLADFNIETVRPRFWAAAQKHLSAKLSADSFPLAKYSVDQILESRHVVFASAFVKTEYEIFYALPRVHRGLTVSFVFPREGYFSNNAKQLVAIQADFGDGSGARDVPFDKAVVIDYLEPGEKVVRLRCSTPRGIYEVAFKLDVAPPTAPVPDAEWSTLHGYKPFEGTTAVGHAWIYFGLDHGVQRTALAKPIIVSEGFPGNYTLDYLWDRLNQQDMAVSLLRAGFDLIILGYQDGTLPIQANAFVAVTCIQRAIAERIGSDPLIVGGASMGGLITRYALTFMENQKIPHQTSKFFTIDTPHGGASIAPSAQAFVQYTASYSAAADAGAKLLRSAAAQQMLLLWVPAYTTWGSGISIGQSPLRQRFLNDLRSIGWMPKQLASAAVSDGVGTGAQNGDTPAALTASFESTACIWANCYVFPLGGEKQTFAWMEISKIDSLVWTFSTVNGLGYDTMPGGQSPTFSEVAKSMPGSPAAVFPNSCFIPTPSACAVNVGAFSPISPGTSSDFGTYKYVASNLMHIDISPELATFLTGFLSTGEGGH